MGFDDEKLRDEEKIPRVIDNMKSLLAPGGKIAITVPRDYNPWLDSYLETGGHPFNRLCHFRRVSRSRWEAIEFEGSPNRKNDGVATSGERIVLFAVFTG